MDTYYPDMVTVLFHLPLAITVYLSAIEINISQGTTFDTLSMSGVMCDAVSESSNMQSVKFSGPLEIAASSLALPFLFDDFPRDTALIGRTGPLSSLKLVFFETKNISGVEWVEEAPTCRMIFLPTDMERLLGHMGAFRILRLRKGSVILNEAFGDALKL